jgi:hypothetical protein
MRPAGLLAVICLFSGVAFGQQPQGLAPEWEIGKVYSAISEHAKRLIPIIDQIDPKSWVAKGASPAYVTQWDSARIQAKAVADSAQALAQPPLKLSPAIELVFRLQALETALGSLGEGLIRYQNPATAELLAGVVAENGASRDHLQQFVVELAAEREAEFAIADQEAQRCRGFLARQPPAQGAPPKRPAIGPKKKAEN